MELYIGGYAQGKLGYVLKKKGNLSVILDTVQLDSYPNTQEIIFNQFHEWFLKRIRQKENPEKEMGQILEQRHMLAIISNEIGNGVVPIDAFEREYRERLGRYLCLMAEKAEKVERILCGIGQKIK